MLPGHAPFPLTELEKIAVEGHQEKVYLVDKINDIDCSLAFYSNWGQYSPKFAELMAQKGIKIEHVPHNIRLADLLRIGINNTVDQSDLYLRKKFKTEDNSSWFPDEDITAFHPFRNSLMKLGRYRSSELFINDEPSTLIIGDTIFDFCLYYCLSRFQDYVFWIPELGTQDGNTHNFTNEDKEILFNTVLSSINQNINLGHSNNVQLLSLSLTSELLAIAKKYIPRLIHAISGISDDFMNRYIINPKLNLSEKYFYRYFELNNYTNLYTETFENNLGVGRIQTPKPKNFGYVHPSEHRWITELNIEGYIPPPLHFLGSQIIELAGSTDVSRVSNSGICYSCPNIAYFGGDIDVVLVRPRLKIVNAINIFQTYFYENGFMDVRISDKGNYAEETIKKFGSLERLGDFFKEEKNWQLFSLFLSTKSRKDGKGEVVFANGRAYIDFKSIHNSVGASEKATKLIDEFIKKGIFYRGLILQCPRCKEADWFDLEDISQQFICKRCKNKDYIQMRNWKESSEPTWYYKLDEVIYQGVNNNMEVPILTLSYLKRKSKRGLLYLPEVELRRNPTAHKPDLEIDICCIQDGQIVLGECKKNQITRKAIDKLNNFSLGLVRNPDRLIFASMSKKTPKGIKEYVEKSLSLSQDFLMEPDLVD